MGTDVGRERICLLLLLVVLVLMIMLVLVVLLVRLVLVLLVLLLVRLVVLRRGKLFVRGCVGKCHGGGVSLSSLRHKTATALHKKGK